MPFLMSLLTTIFLFYYLVVNYHLAVNIHNHRAGLKRNCKNKQKNQNKTKDHKNSMIQSKGIAAPSSNPSVRHLVLDLLTQTLVAQTKANAKQACNHPVISLW